MASKHGGSLPKRLREAKRADKKLAKQRRKAQAGGSGPGPEPAGNSSSSGTHPAKAAG